MNAVRHLNNDRERTPRGQRQHDPRGGVKHQGSWSKGGKGDSGHGKGKGYSQGWNKGYSPDWYKGGKPKGGNGGKGNTPGKGGKAGGFARGLLHETPDKLQICFDFNTAAGCRGGCNRVHICRMCGQPDHGMHENKCRQHPLA